jgi:hypothetical protein
MGFTPMTYRSEPWTVKAALDLSPERDPMETPAKCAITSARLSALIALATRAFH